MTATGTSSSARRRNRDSSFISFPYVDLYAAMELAGAVYASCGTEPCDLNQLAGGLDSGASGTFRLKTAAARIFALVEKKGRGEIQLTRGGIAILDKQESVSARVHAFLNVPLYAAVYQKYPDRKLPHRDRLEDEMKSLGVPPKQVGKARQVFERSARQAGLFDMGPVPAPLHAPQNRNTSPLAADVMTHDEGSIPPVQSDPADMARLLRRDDPLLVGLIERLPAAGSAWADADRIAWLRLASSIFDVTYREGSGLIAIQMGNAPAEPSAEEDAPSSDDR